MSKIPNGFIFYRGPSMLDGSPIVAIATRVTSDSKNSKTGALVATYILRADLNPVDAVRQGKDASICGSCVHRGHYDPASDSWKDRSCYVVIGQGPLGVYNGFERDIYPEVSPEQACEWLADHAVRLGTYGDPVAVPFHVWHTMLARVAAKAGYTHQWRVASEMKRYCMASCDTAEEQQLAVKLGWRAFRTRLPFENKLAGEIACPASMEKGYATTCAACRACGGTSAKAKASITIIAHGGIGQMRAYTRTRARIAEIAAKSVYATLALSNHCAVPSGLKPI
jgi:hypothetical protein